MTDRITLTIPTASSFRGIATLVLGGIGSRLDLPYERVDDLQLAVLSVLEISGDGAVTLEAETAPDALVVNVGPLAQEAGSDEALARVLHPLVDSFEATKRADGHWLSLHLAR